jgi:hypothetical protein
LYAAASAFVASSFFDPLDALAAVGVVEQALSSAITSTAKAATTPSPLFLTMYAPDQLSRSWPETQR